MHVPSAATLASDAKFLATEARHPSTLAVQLPTGLTVATESKLIAPLAVQP